MPVFISHSSRRDPHTAQVRTLVRQRLTELNHEVWVDTDGLPANEEWRSILFHWLAECDAAIILVNEEALASHWVRREVDILLWRRALGSPVYLVPVRVGVDIAALKASGLAELAPIQGFSCQPGDDPGALVDKIVSGFAELPRAGLRTDPMSRWIERTADQLGTIDPARRRELENAARELGVRDEDLGHVLAPHGGNRFLAHQLLGRWHDARLFRALTEIAPWLRLEPLQRLVHEVMPTWVDGTAARRLLPPADRAGRFVVVLNARDPRTAEHYIARATCRAILGYAHVTTGGVRVGEGGVAELVVEYENAVRAFLGLQEPWPLDGLTPPAEETYYLVVKPPEQRMDLAAAAIRTLLARLPWLAVILLTGSEVPDEASLRQWRLDDAVVPLPLLQAGEERFSLMTTHQMDDLPRRLGYVRE